MACEPLDDDLADSDAGYLASDAVDGEAESCVGYLCLHVAAEGYPDGSIAKVLAD